VRHATAFLRQGAGHHFWSSFLVILESHAAADHEATAIDGALHAFAMFEEVASRLGRPSMAAAGIATA
jgi:heme oxygenase